MAKSRNRLIGLGFAALVVPVVLFTVTLDAAIAQTPSELKFLNGPLSLRAKHGDQEAREACPDAFSRDVETATATVFVLLSGSQEATRVKFLSEVPAAGGRGQAGRAHKTLVAQNKLKVQARVAANEEPGKSIEPSDVKAFTLTFLICSASESPGLPYYLFNSSIPVEWSNLAGQIVMKDADNPGEIVPGTVSLQLNRPALGYAQAYFVAISLIALVVWLATTYWMYASITDAGKLPLAHTADFRSTYVAPLTTATALFGTVFSTTLLPTDTFFMSKGAYAALNVLFLVIVIIAAVLHNHHDKAGSFLVAAGLTLGAAAGELITVFFLAKEMGFQGSLPAPMVSVFQGLLMILWFVVILLGCKAVVSEINKKKVPKKEEFIPVPRLP